MIAAVLKEYGSVGAFGFIALCMIIVVIAIGGFGPRTNFLSLEEINSVAMYQKKLPSQRDSTSQ